MQHQSSHWLEPTHKLLSRVQITQNSEQQLMTALMVSIDSSAYRNVVGTYIITYTATDGTNQATATRTVNVVDTTAPIITLTGANPQTIESGADYTELGATTDDGSVVSVDSSAYRNVVGTYIITYTDAAAALVNYMDLLTCLIIVFCSCSSSKLHGLVDMSDHFFLQLLLCELHGLVDMSDHCFLQLLL